MPRHRGDSGRNMRVIMLAVKTPATEIPPLISSYRITFLRTRVGVHPAASPPPPPLGTPGTTFIPQNRPPEHVTPVHRKHAACLLLSLLYRRIVASKRANGRTWCCRPSAWKPWAWPSSRWRNPWRPCWRPCVPSPPWGKRPNQDERHAGTSEGVRAEQTKRGHEEMSVVDVRERGHA